MRAGRLIAEIVHLQQRGPTTAAVLAEELEVSVRTIYRDIAELQAAGVPLWTEAGPGGGIRLLEGWQNQLGGLTAAEADALFLGSGSAAAQLGLGSVLAAAQSKLRSTLPPELRARATRVTDRFLLDAPGWFHHEEPVEHLATVAEAVWSGRRIDVGYRRRPGAEVVTRRLDPLGLVLKAGVWYLVARHRWDIRTFRVARLTRVTVRDDHVDRPEGFALDAWWRASAAEFDRSLLRTRIRVRVSPSAHRQLRLVFGAAAVDAAVTVEDDGHEGASEDDAVPGGWVTLDLPVEDEQVACHQLLQLGAGVEVLAPRSLRAAVRDLAMQVAARNR